MRSVFRAVRCEAAVSDALAPPPMNPPILARASARAVEDAEADAFSIFGATTLATGAAAFANAELPSDCL